MLLARLRAGDSEAGHRFVQDYYPGVYRYLLYLTGSPETAEDLTQETFLQAWLRLDTFEGRAALRTWLHRIAHREFLQALRSRRVLVPLETVCEIPEPSTIGMTETIELRAILSKLPAEEREIVVLHYLEGYQHEEIPHLLGIPLRRVRQRLSEARGRLQQEMAEGDLLYLNEPSRPGARIAGGRQWGWLPLEEMYALATRLNQSAAVTEETMERREFLRHAAVGAAGLMLTEPEREIVDSRLTQKVTCAFKGTALSDLCEQLKSGTDIRVTAGPSVADEKVTLFCEKLPLREVMRQLSRPFGYTWLRRGTPGQYRYELVQDLRSQLLEEELRNRDRDAALLALEAEIERYRPYLSLSPDEALARARSAPPAEKKLLETLSGTGWAAIQIYTRLAPGDLAAMRAGERVRFRVDPRPGDRPLPPEITRGVLQAFRDWRVARQGDGYKIAFAVPGAATMSLSEVPGAGAGVSLTIKQSELGRTALEGEVFWFTVNSAGKQTDGGSIGDDYATGVSPVVLQPNNAVANAKLARDPALGQRVTISPVSSGQQAEAEKDRDLPVEGDQRPPPVEPKLTTADVLEALHRATGLPIVSDFYTRLYPMEKVSLKDRPLFDALNQLADTMRMRWHRDAGTAAAREAWLQFRSASFYDDRRKEVPNRLLSRWAAARREHGILRLDDLVEIAGLPDAQLDASEMAEGARDWWGLVEWDLARKPQFRQHLRYLAALTPAQRQEAQTGAGLPFSRMSLVQQQQFLALGFDPDSAPLQTPEELADATLRVEYTQPGGFQWGDSGHPGQGSYLRWVVPLEPGRRGKRVPRPPIQARTREAALQAVRRIDSEIRAALLQAMHRVDSRTDLAPHVVEEDQIFPTKLDMAFVYIPGSASGRPIKVKCSFAEYNPDPPE
jgi:RNA polymerase sigma-70 factor (ECF subfamily)